MKYLLNIEFCEKCKGEENFYSNSIISNYLCLFQIKEDLSKTQVVNMFTKVNSLLLEKDSSLSISYEINGKNIETLLKAIEELFGGKMKIIKDSCGYIAAGNYYEIRVEV